MMNFSGGVAALNHRLIAFDPSGVELIQSKKHCQFQSKCHSSDTRMALSYAKLPCSIWRFISLLGFIKRSYGLGLRFFRLGSNRSGRLATRLATMVSITSWNSWPGIGLQYRLWNASNGWKASMVCIVALKLIVRGRTSCLVAA